MIRAGRLRTRIRIQSPTVTQDTYGAVLKTWQTDLICFADVTELTGKEIYSDMARGEDTPVRIICRWQKSIDGVDSGHRILRDDDTVYDVKSVIDNMERKRMVTIICTRGRSE